jgi:hypothetical protein
MQQAKQIEVSRETQTPTRLVIPGLLVVTPAVVFYGLLFKLLLDLPIVDDYWAVLGFANRMAVTHGTAARFQFFLASQHNEYKLFFVHALVWVQTTLLGHVNFAQLSVLGDSAVLIIAVLLWSMFLPGQKDLGRRLAYFVPVSWILFELQYFETLNWAMASLQNLWVIVFSLGTIRYLGQRTRKTYGAALILYVLAIAASGNGFLLLPVGLLMLLVSRQYVRAAGWIIVTSVCVAAYAYHWTSILRPTQRPVIVSLLRTRPDFVIAFVGNAGAIAGTRVLSEWLSLFLGLSLLVYFAWLLRRGYFRRNPPVGYCVLFLLLTAAGVGGIRSEFGLMQGLASRYIIYGLLLVIFAWMSVVEEFFWTRKGPLLNNDLYLLTAVATVFLGLCMDAARYLDLSRRNSETIEGMALYEHPNSPSSMDGPVLVFSRSDDASRRKLEPVVRSILSESIQLGVYEPPKL